MIEILRKFLWDQAYAEQYIRMAAFTLASLISTGVINLGQYGWWVQFPLLAVAGFVKAGQKNGDPNPPQIPPPKAATP